MSSRNSVGSLGFLIMLSIDFEDRYLAEIVDLLEGAGHEVTSQACYASLQRLERLEYVESVKVPRPGSPPVRSYSLTAAGLKESDRWLAIVEHLSQCKTTQETTND